MSSCMSPLFRYIQASGDPMYFYASLLLFISFLLAGAAPALLLLQTRLDRGLFAFSLEPVAKALHLLITGFMTVSSVILLLAFINCDFAVEYVAQYSDKTLPLFYRITAFWAGQSGSMLFWAWSVAIGGAIFAFMPAYRRLSTGTRLWYWIFFFAIMAFFLLILTTWSNPFITLSPPPPDGRGLNPLLQNPGMIFHPPLLFLGYGGFVVPGCLALAQTLSGRLYDPESGSREEESWGQASRSFIFAAWSLLTAGIILGAWWAYMELGWGGYWAWDPVENASLIPWLVASAYLHTAVIESRRGKLQRVNVFLMALTTISAFFATYLVRSGVVESLHAFGDGGVGTPLLIFTLASLYLSLFISLCAPVPGEEPRFGLAQPLLFCAAGILIPVGGYLAATGSVHARPVMAALAAGLCLALFAGRTSNPKARALEDLTSKEGLLVLVAWLLLALSFIILIATLWPVIINGLRGIADLFPEALRAKLPAKPMGLEPEFYNRTCLPLFALLSLLLVFCPWRKWKITWKGSGFSQTKLFLAVLGLTLATAAGLYLSGIRQPVALLAASCSVGALAGIIVLFGANKALLNIRSSLAAHGVHVGLLMVVLGVAFSGPYQLKHTLELARQQTGKVGEYTVLLNQLYEGESQIGPNGKPNFHFLEAELFVTDKDGKFLGKLSPQRRLYANFENQTYAEVSTIFSLGKEIYATLLSVDENGKATLAVNVNPLVNWLWIGGILMCLFPFLSLTRVRRLKEDEELPEPAVASGSQG